MKTIHFIWLDPCLGRSNKIPESIQSNINTFEKYHPDHEILVWDYDRIKACFVDQKELLHAFELCKFEAMKSDLMRVAIIHKYGGLYCDVKNHACRSFLFELVNLKLPVICEHPPTIANYTGILSNCFLYSHSGSDFCRRVLEIIIENILNKRSDGGVVNVTGVNTWKRALYPMDKSTYTIIPASRAWDYNGTGGWMRRVSAKYNGINMINHWSKRQSNESIYNDTV